MVVHQRLQIKSLVYFLWQAPPNTMPLFGAHHIPIYQIEACIFVKDAQYKFTTKDKKRLKGMSSPLVGAQ